MCTLAMELHERDGSGTYYDDDNGYWRARDEMRREYFSIL